jgi:hypothetical protein
MICPLCCAALAPSVGTSSRLQKSPTTARVGRRAAALPGAVQQFRQGDRRHRHPARMRVERGQRLRRALSDHEDDKVRVQQITQHHDSDTSASRRRQRASRGACVWLARPFRKSPLVAGASAAKKLSQG